LRLRLHARAAIAVQSGAAGAAAAIALHSAVGVVEDLMRQAQHCAPLAAILLFAALAPASAASCRDDLIKADQDFHRTRTALHNAVNAAPVPKCTAYRQHVTALTQVRNVFARCDTSPNKAKNAAKTNSEIAELTKQMRQTCATAAPVPAHPKKS
jgi:hypothetical protein